MPGACGTTRRDLLPDACCLLLVNFNVDANRRGRRLSNYEVLALRAHLISGRRSGVWTVVCRADSRRAGARFSTSPLTRVGPLDIFPSTRILTLRVRA
jgi:hypothetical protein